MYVSLSVISHSNGEGFLVVPDINNTQEIITEDELPLESTA